MRRLFVLLFSLTAIGGLSGCVHHSVEYRGSPHIVPHDSIVIRSTPYYRSTHVTKTIIVPHERQFHSKYHYKKPYQASSHYKKPKHNKYYKKSKPVKRSFLHNKVIKNAKRQQREVHKKVVKKRIYKTERNNSFLKPKFDKRNRKLVNVKETKKIKKIRRVARQKELKTEYSQGKKEVRQQRVNKRQDNKRQDNFREKRARNSDDR